jgi:hypothetical protein
MLDIVCAYKKKQWKLETTNQKQGNRRKYTHRRPKAGPTDG